jgi:hypothetical protein
MDFLLNNKMLLHVFSPALSKEGAGVKSKVPLLGKQRRALLLIKE